MASRTQKSEETYRSWIGRQVYKRSRKPFKSGEKRNTVRGVVPHPQLDKLCFLFEEDDTYVTCDTCILAEEV